MSLSWDAAVFDRLYAQSDDPWNFSGSAYEKAKYAHSLSVLGDRMFPRGLEVGCSIGVLTRLLAARCENLLAIDGSQPALTLARRRCPDLHGVRFARAQVPAEWPDQVFDLMVFSEVLYFLDSADLTAVAEKAAHSLAPSGLIVLVNWTGETNTPTGGDEAARHFIRASGLQSRHTAREPLYRLDVVAAA